MIISTETCQMIRVINVNRVSTKISYPHWESHLAADKEMLDRLNFIKAKLGEDVTSVTRQQIVDFYADANVAPEIKFLLAMIWGHEAPEEGRRDGRGPWKIMRMFEQREKTDALIRQVDLSTNENLIDSYQKLDKGIDRCGPNFFTKHFYFLGKSSGMPNYPLIFDDRVANGLVKLMQPTVELFSMIHVSTLRQATAYTKFLRLAHQIAQDAQAQPDQVELFLFGQVS